VVGASVLAVLGCVVSLRMTGDWFLFDSLNALTTNVTFTYFGDAKSFLSWYALVRDAVLVALIGFSLTTVLCPSEKHGKAAPFQSLELKFKTEVLSMQSRRLNFLLYAGSLLMVLGVFQVGALLNLFVQHELAAHELGMRPATPEGWESSLRVVSDSIVVPEGIFFSLLLATVYLIPRVSIIHRAKEVLRARGLHSFDRLEERKKFLEAHGLSDSLLPSFKSVAALIGPTVVAPAAGYIGRVLQSGL
jgi:hypothetical protein